MKAVAKASTWTRQFKAFLLECTEIALPHLCVHCEEEGVKSENPALCPKCIQVFWQMPRCRRCDAPCHESELNKRRCQHCRHISYPYHSFQSLGPYSGWLRQAILDYKFRHDEMALRYLMKLMQTFKAPEKGSALSYIPSHKERLRERGTKTQHMLPLVQSLAKTHQLPIVQLLEKGHTPKAQVDLKGDDRRDAVSGSFSFICPDSLPKSIYIYDDVWTTGSTLKEACRVLKDGGIEKIYAFTLASPAYLEKNSLK
ncbi:MAG: ComF family protein [Planctomycetes bacterium]|nr:ComF family protein [Planctomycetota bacterium]